ncbi:MAG: metal-dependent hydrolase [Candidatus Hodarchaeales archaeon]|jgi:hypothetical protein
MTILTTHISLAGIVFWSFLSSTEKINFKEKKYLFWIVLAFSILPDIDIFFGVHRGLSHSLIPPTFLVLSGISIHILNQFRINTEKDTSIKSIHHKNAFKGRIFLYAGLLWIFHLLLDFEYPLAIFYPLSDRLYQLDFVYILSLVPWLFFPVMIVGAEFHLTSISYLQGISSYFVNLTPSGRIDVFGTDIIAIRIEDLFIHLFLLLIFIQVTKPMLPKLSHIKIRNLKTRIQFDGYVLTTGLIILLIGVVMGPMIGTQVTDDSTQNSSFRISSTSFAPSVALAIDPSSYLFQPNTIMKVSGNLIVEPQSGEFDHVLLISSKEDYNSFIRDLSSLFKNTPPNSSKNLTSFSGNYSILLDQLYSTALAMNLSNLNETTIYTEILSSPIIVVSVMENWNDTLVLSGSEQRMSVHLSIIVITSRFSLFIIGLGAICLGIVTIIISVILKKPNIINSPQTQD